MHQSFPAYYVNFLQQICFTKTFKNHQKNSPHFLFFCFFIRLQFYDKENRNQNIFLPKKVFKFSKYFHFLQLLSKNFFNPNFLNQIYFLKMIKERHIHFILKNRVTCFNKRQKTKRQKMSQGLKIKPNIRACSRLTCNLYHCNNSVSSVKLHVLS